MNNFHQKSQPCQVVGVSGRRPERRAGVLPVAAARKTVMRLKERKDLGAASETVVHQGDAKSFDAFILKIITAEDVIVYFSLNYHSLVNCCHVYSQRGD